LTIANQTMTRRDAASTRRVIERILVVDDETAITELVSAALRFVGFDVEAVSSGREAILAIDRLAPDLVILDVMLPDLDGFEVLRRLRAAGDLVPVIFLTARDEPENKLRGFTHGGDDYLTKPFSLEELVARLRAILRRSGGQPGEAPNRYRYADLELDDDGHRVWRGEEIISLSPTEYRLLRYLLINAGRVLSKNQILDHVWEYDFAGEASIVETYISYLRKKIDTHEPKLIQTIRGFGYSLRTDPGSR
jgi:two-component system, OmpR family, response regulator